MAPPRVFRWADDQLAEEGEFGELPDASNEPLDASSEAPDG
jgi:hypothetical protein